MRWIHIHFLISVLLGLVAVSCRCDHNFSAPVVERTCGEGPKEGDVGVSFRIEGRTFLYFQDEGCVNWYIREVLADGKLGQYTDRSRRKYFDHVQFSFAIGNRTFLYGQSMYKKIMLWFIQELLPGGKMGNKTDNGRWNEFYPIQFPFTLDGKTYLHAHTSNNNSMFIQELLSKGKMGKKVTSFSPQHFYPVLFPYYAGNKTFIVRHRYCDNFWSIYEVRLCAALDGKICLGTPVTGNWDTFYPANFPFVVNKRTFNYRQAQDDNRWYITELLGSGEMGANDTDAGTLDDFYLTVPIDGGGRQFFLGYNNRRWFIRELLEGGKMGEETDSSDHVPM